MTHSLASRAAAGTLLTLLVLAGGAPTASARPAPGDVGSFTDGNRPLNCALMRIGTQLVRCDNLTGAGVSAPLFIPEVKPLVQPAER